MPRWQGKGKGRKKDNCKKEQGKSNFTSWIIGMFITGESLVGWGAVLFLWKTLTHAVLQSNVQPPQWTHPINSVWTLYMVPKAFLQLRFRIKTPSRPGDTFLLSPKPLFKFPGTQNVAEESRGLLCFTLLCEWLDETPGDTFSSQTQTLWQHIASS